jgi:outer membrane biosynthesis protein TonB
MRPTYMNWRILLSFGSLCVFMVSVAILTIETESSNDSEMGPCILSCMNSGMVSMVNTLAIPILKSYRRVKPAVEPVAKPTVDPTAKPTAEPTAKPVVEEPTVEEPTVEEPIINTNRRAKPGTNTTTDTTKGKPTGDKTTGKPGTNTTTDTTKGKPAGDKTTGKPGTNTTTKTTGKPATTGKPVADPSDICVW